MARYEELDPEEIWYPIPSLPDYELSSNLRVRSFRVPGRSKDGTYGGRGEKWRVIGVRTMANGYLSFVASINGKGKPIYIHHVIAELAYGHKSNEGTILHYDDRKSNNYPSNLSIGDQAANVRDAKRNGLISRGEQRANAKLTEELVRKVRQSIDEGITHRSIASTFDISVALVSFIRNNKAWAHVS